MSDVQTIWRAPAMSYRDAMSLLNRRRRGEDMDEQQILKALEMTGDYDPDAGFEPLWEID